MINVDPVSGRDYPKTWVQFEDWFATEIACVAYIEKLRWPGGFCCPACGVVDPPTRASRRRLILREKGNINLAQYHAESSVGKPLRQCATCRVNSLAMSTISPLSL